uniref:Uncharacterized protein n=1 Tax=uncultured prokaryote TaxID=198431 RepID=A0A0H5Q7D8_9ZZZZ|nr:hypothetical protein [uncultured prokaryote]
MVISSNDYLAQVTINKKSMVPADAMINTYAFRSTGGIADFTALTGVIEDAYQFASTLFANTVIANGAGQGSMKFYALADAKPREPVAETVWQPMGTSGLALPAEVAICSSMAATAGSGVPAARRRGRVFLGGLASSTSETVAGSGEVRVTSAAQQKAAELVQQIAQQAAGEGFDLCVWSRADNGLFTVVRGWANDEFDTQRRRGIKPSTRFTWNVAP